MLEQEYNKGELGGIELMLMIPETFIENLKIDIEHKEKVDATKKDT